MVDFDEILNAPLMGVFGMEGQVAHIGGSEPFDAVFAFTRDPTIVEMGQTLGQAGDEQILFTRTSALPSGRTLSQGDVVTLQTPRGPVTLTIWAVPDIDETGFTQIHVMSGAIPVR